MESKLKSLIFGLVFVAALLVGTLVWIWIDRQAMIDDLIIEKDSLTEQMFQLQDDYSILSTENDTINLQLDVEKEKVIQLIGRIKKTDAKNRSQMRRYEKELGTLRSIMRHYIVQIDSLNTLNISLKKDVVLARKEARTSREKYADLRTTADEYARQVEKGSVLRGRGVNVLAITRSNKETNRSSRVEKLKTCMYLIENSLTTKGPKQVYVRIKGPDGILMTENQQQIFQVNNQKMIYSAVREVDYQGAEIEICIYFESGHKFTKGVYTIDAYTNEGKLGSSDLYLR